MRHRSPSEPLRPVREDCRHPLRGYPHRTPRCPPGPSRPPPRLDLPHREADPLGAALRLERRDHGQERQEHVPPKIRLPVLRRVERSLPQRVETHPDRLEVEARLGRLRERRLPTVPIQGPDQQVGPRSIRSPGVRPEALILRSLDLSGASDLLGEYLDDRPAPAIRLCAELPLLPDEVLVLGGHPRVENDALVHGRTLLPDPIRPLPLDPLRSIGTSSETDSLNDVVSGGASSPPVMQAFRDDASPEGMGATPEVAGIVRTDNRAALRAARPLACLFEDQAIGPVIRHSIAARILTSFSSYSTITRAPGSSW